MLKILFAKTLNEIKSMNNIVFDAEYEFMGVNLNGTDTTNKIIKYIEDGTYYDETSFIDRFGIKCYYDCMSTGCKAALLVAEYPDKIINCIECGSNALEAIIKYCKNGTIITYDDDVFDNIKVGNNDIIDVELDSKHFTLGRDLNDYIELER